jgi:hypothetical protein
VTISGDHKQEREDKRRREEVKKVSMVDVLPIQE